MKTLIGFLLASALPQRSFGFHPVLFSRRPSTSARFSIDDDAVATEKPNGEELLESLESVTAVVSQDELLPEAPPLLLDKYMTMQDKRVVVTIRYSGGASLKPYFLTVAKKLKLSHPDVIIERQILPSVLNSDVEATFEVLVDGKVVVGNGRVSKQKVGQVDMAHSRSVFVSMQELDVAISRSRRKRRPAKVYGDDEKTPEMPRLEVLRKIKASKDGSE